MIEARQNILTSGVLAKFVLGEEGHEFHVLRILKERDKDPIYYQVGLPNLKSMAVGLQMDHRDIGFGGKVQRFLDWDVRITRGGGSLSAEYQPSKEENDVTFALIEAMLGELDSVLYWDIL